MDFDRHHLAAIIWAERPETERAPRRQLHLCLDKLRMTEPDSLTPHHANRLRLAIDRIQHFIALAHRQRPIPSRLRGRRRPGRLDRDLGL